MSVIGYARVSTFDQTLDVQQALLRNAGATHIFGEHFTGKSRVGREQLDACLASLERGDTLLVVRLDRLARSITDLWSVLKDLDARGVMFALASSLEEAMAEIRKADPIAADELGKPHKVYDAPVGFAVWGGS